jgi:hypothetical protein
VVWLRLQSIDPGRTIGTRELCGLWLKIPGNKRQKARQICVKPVPKVGALNTPQTNRATPAGSRWDAIAGKSLFHPPGTRPAEGPGTEGGGAREHGEAFAFVRFGSPPTNNHAGRCARSVPCDRSCSSAKSVPGHAANPDRRTSPSLPASPRRPGCADAILRKFSKRCSTGSPKEPTRSSFPRRRGPGEIG